MPDHQDLIASLKTEIAQDLGFTVETLPSQLNATQTAKILNVTANTLSVWRCLGRHNLPFVKTGKSPMYRVSDVVAFMARHYFEHADKVVGGAA